MLLFKGNLLRSFRPILIWTLTLGIGAAMAVRLIGKDDWLGMAGLLLVLIAVFFGSSNWTFYFALSGDQLIIRNHQCFWYRRSFELSIISKVVIDATGADFGNGFEIMRNRPVGLRLFLHPQNPRQYYACTLRNKDWKALTAALQERNIPIEQVLVRVNPIKW